MAKRRKKKRTQPKSVVDDGSQKVPKTFVFVRGDVGDSVRALMLDFRKVMEPNTAANLKEKRSNKLKDFIAMSGPLGVTHLLVFSTTDLGSYCRLLKAPHGPTLTFRIVQYSLAKDVLASQKRPHAPGSEFLTAPLVVLNNFGEQENHVKLMSAMFQNMFPPINVQQVVLSNCRRVVLLHRNKDTGTLEFRHYAITASPLGISKNIKKVVQARIPKLNNLEDVADYVLGYDAGSDSEAEDGPETRVTLPTDYVGAGNRRANQSAIRLVELGPRMQLQLVKIEEGVVTGQVIYHAFVKKTPEEIASMEEELRRRREEKARRKALQAENVKRKKDAQGKGRGRRGPKQGDHEGGPRRDCEEGEADAPDDDAQWYRDEVGAEPDPGEIRSGEAQRRHKFNPLYKKRRADHKGHQPDLGTDSGKDGPSPGRAGGSKRPGKPFRKQDGGGAPRKRKLGGAGGSSAKRPRAH